MTTQYPLWKVFPGEPLYKECSPEEDLAFEVQIIGEADGWRMDEDGKTSWLRPADAGEITAFVTAFYEHNRPEFGMLPLDVQLYTELPRDVCELVHDSISGEAIAHVSFRREAKVPKLTGRTVPHYFTRADVPWKATRRPGPVTRNDHP